MAEKLPEKKKQPIEFEAAIRLDAKDRVKGLQVKGSAMPFGGSWSYDKSADVLTLDEVPTIIP